MLEKLLSTEKRLRMRFFGNDCGAFDIEQPLGCVLTIHEWAVQPPIVIETHPFVRHDIDHKTCYNEA
jgi:hypothetical protein